MTWNLCPTLAFGFASPWLLGGLALGAIPIIIHLLHKRQYREVPWAAMRFLLEATRRNSRRLRLEQLLLLAVRTLILILLVLGLARPYVESFAGYFQTEQPTHRIIVIDASYSMGYQAGETSLFDQARDMAREIVSGARRGDAFHLLRISSTTPRTIIRQPSYQRGRVVDEIDQLERTDEFGDVAATLEEIGELLRQVPNMDRKQVVLISDFQAESWAPPAKEDRAQIRRLLDGLADQSRLIMLDVGHKVVQNAAIVRFDARESIAAIGQPVNLQAGVRYSGVSTLPGQLVELYVDGRLAETERIDLVPDQEVSVSFAYPFLTGGEHRLEVRLPDDGLSIDNHRWLSLPVRDEVQVLLVNGRRAGISEETATHYLKLALAPTASDRGPGLIRPVVIDEGELLTTDLSRYDCVFVCNVALVSDREADILTTYVASGGGLIICLGDQVRPASYNRHLYRNGRGILPAQLGERVGDAGAKNEVFLFDTDDLTHPLMAEFRGNPGAGLEATMTFEYFRANVPETSPARTALQFQTGDPAILDKPFGHGRCLLVTTSVDDRWGTWAVWAPSYVPIMHEMVNYAVAGHWRERQLLVGDPIHRSFPTRAYGISAIVRKPDGSEEPLRLDDAGDIARLSFDETRQQGIYEVKLAAPLNRMELFAVNVDPRESVLRKADETELKAEALAGVDFVYRTGWREMSETSGGTVTDRNGLTRWLLAAVLVLLFIEPLLAWRFFAGFLLLSVAVVLAFFGQAVAVEGWGIAALRFAVLGGVVALLIWRQGRTAASRSRRH